MRTFIGVCTFRSNVFVRIPTTCTLLFLTHGVDLYSSLFSLRLDARLSRCQCLSLVNLPIRWLHVEQSLQWITCTMMSNTMCLGGRVLLSIRHPTVALNAIAAVRLLDMPDSISASGGCFGIIQGSEFFMRVPRPGACFLRFC